MQTIILSQKMPPGYGGRPAHLGKLVWEEEGNKGFGFFVGYSPDGKRVGLKAHDLEKCWENISWGDYKIRVTIENQKKFSLLQSVTNLIPDKIKQEIRQTI